MTIFDFISDLQTNAPPERAGVWLRTNADAWPDLASAINTNLYAAPEAVIDALSQHWPLARIYYRHTNALNYIRKLQQWMRDHPQGASL
jgi:hypothetical protein